jgi:hypothetical protein
MKKDRNTLRVKLLMAYNGSNSPCPPSRSKVEFKASIKPTVVRINNLDIETDEAIPRFWILSRCLILLLIGDLQNERFKSIGKNLDRFHSKSTSFAKSSVIALKGFSKPMTWIASSIDLTLIPCLSLCPSLWGKRLWLIKYTTAGLFIYGGEA